MTHVYNKRYVSILLRETVKRSLEEIINRGAIAEVKELQGRRLIRHPRFAVTTVLPSINIDFSIVAKH